MVVVETASAMQKLAQAGAEKTRRITGKSPKQMEPEELDQAMTQAGIQPQPVTAEDQQAMAAAEANDPNPDEEVEAPEQGACLSGPTPGPRHVVPDVGLARG